MILDYWSAALIAAGAAGVAAALLLVWRRSERGRPAQAKPKLPAAPPRVPRGLREGLRATSRRLLAQLDAALGRGPRGLDEVFSAVEEALLLADVGVKTTGELLGRVRSRVNGPFDPDQLRKLLREEIEGALVSETSPTITTRPWVVLVTGVNGVGKTTTIGKLAALHAAAGRKVMLVAADTFRAAAIDQLAVWAERSGAQLIRQAPEADPAAVVYDGMKAAVARGMEVVLVDTAGRLHTRTNLMEELRKIRRVIAREVDGAPHETLLVLDATTGQNAIAQARTFSEALTVTGVILTKLDGTARGGVALAVRRELGLPIRYVGVGESADDLRPFDAHEFAEALFGEAGAPE